MLYAQYSKMKGWNNLDDFRPNDVSTRVFGAILISKATGKCLNDIFDISERRLEEALNGLAFKTILKKA